MPNEIKNLKDGTLELEIYHEDGMRIFMSDENGSGVSYKVNNVEEISQHLAQYLIDNFLMED